MNNLPLPKGSLDHNDIDQLAGKRSRSLPGKFPTSVGVAQPSIVNYLPNTVLDLIPDQNPIKRPRGRPPLAINTSNKGPDKLGSSSLDDNQNMYFQSSDITPQATEAEEPANDATKVARIPPAIIVQKILGRLSIDDPMSIPDLTKAFPDIPKDSIQATIDVLTIFGIVIALKSKEVAEANVSHHSHNNSANVLYTVYGFAKGTEPLELNRLEQSIAEKHDHIAKLKARIKIFEVSFISCFFVLLSLENFYKNINFL